jgi:hypothetical protein
MVQGFGRRNFIRGIGAAFGLQALLRNLEAKAQGARSPARLLIVHHPIGTILPYFMPTGTGTTYTSSPLLQPFQQNLRSDMVVLTGLRNVAVGAGGPHERATVALMTGVPPRLLRRNCFVADDSCADGPSFDQIFLDRAPHMRAPGSMRSINVICDGRTDYGEISNKCLSYSNNKQMVSLAFGGTGTENVPLMPVLSPMQAYQTLFSNFVPGGATAANVSALERARLEKKSVLDLSARELRRIQTLAPASERATFESQLATIRAVERELDVSMAVAVNGTCSPQQPPNVIGKSDQAPYPECSGSGGGHYSNPLAPADDKANHAAVAQAHWSVIKAAFVCDVIRVATFQFSPGENHVAFGGFFPTFPNNSYYHHPMSHQIGGAEYSGSTPPANPSAHLTFLFKVEEWYNTLLADLLLQFKNTTDTFGSSLLGYTVVPYLTEVGHPGHTMSQMNALLFGGSALGMRGGQHLAASRTINELWGTIALSCRIPTGAPLGTPIPGVWMNPPG